MNVTGAGHVVTPGCCRAVREDGAKGAAVCPNTVLLDFGRLNDATPAGRAQHDRGVRTAGTVPYAAVAVRRCGRDRVALGTVLVRDVRQVIQAYIKARLDMADAALRGDVQNVCCLRASASGLCRFVNALSRFQDLDDDERLQEQLEQLPGLVRLDYEVRASCIGGVPRI